MFSIKKLIVLLLCASLVFQTQFGIAGPQKGKVVGGNANISQSGPNTTINQTSDRAIINWNSFNIGKNESVRHNMPSSNSAGLHRVVGKGGPSQIEGLLRSNGNIYLVNPAGVVIHNGAKIDVNGFVATTRDIDNDNFMKGKMVFDKPGLPGAAIINQGNISLRDNGLAALVAPSVRNDGIIAGKLGKIALGGSDAAWKLDMTGDDLIAFTMDEKTVNTLHAVDGTPLASARNNGKIKAEGGVVVLTASQMDGIVGSVVNNGEISAASVETKGGKIIFRGQGNKVDLVNKGQLDVSSKAGDGGAASIRGQAAVVYSGKIDATGQTKGGNVEITGEKVTLKAGSSIDASGTNGGGTVLVGGNARGQGPLPNAKTTLVESDAEILASAKLNGDGGQVVVWADDKTQFDGNATARGGEKGGNGGFVETSARLLIIGDPAVVDTRANKGKSGEWLLDPEDFVVAASGGTMTGQQISNNLKYNNVTIETTASGSGNGDIFVNDEIEWSNSSQLALVSRGSIYILKEISASGDNAKLILRPIQSIIIDNGKVNLTGKKQKLIMHGKEYTIIHDIKELQCIEDSLYFNHSRLLYVLGNDIDAKETMNWNDGLGFSPLGSKYNFFGEFDGLGHSINNLYINRPEEDSVGLFKILGDKQNFNALIRNVKLNDVNITGKDYVGAIAGKLGDSNIYGDMTKITITGKIKGKDFVGGLAGSSNFRLNNICIGSTNEGYTSVYGSDRVGGLIGHNTGAIEETKVVNTNIEGIYRVGGLSGLNAGEINQAYVKASIKGYQLVGGFTGAIDSSVYNGITMIPTNKAKILNSYVIGDVTLDTTRIHGNLHPDGGGFAGNSTRDGIIENCYAAVTVSYTDKAISTFGGFVHDAYGPIVIRNSYWDEELSGINIPLINSYTGKFGSPIYENLNGLTTSAMHLQQNYIGWDFKNIWIINKNDNYPELRFIAKNDIVSPDSPVKPSHPIVAPDPVPNPDPKPDVTPRPETPDQPDKPYNPDKPTQPSGPSTPNAPSQNPGYVDLTENPYPNGPYILQPNRPGELNTHYIKNGISVTVGGEMEVTILDENGNPTTQSSNNENIAISHENKNIIPPSRAREIINELVQSVEKQIGKQVYDSLIEKSETEELALNQIKETITTSPPKKLPDGLYVAFAEAVLESAKKSNFASYGKDPKEFLKEFSISLIGGGLSGTKDINIDGITYKIILGGQNLGGVGLNCASVSWKDSNNKTHNEILSFASSPKKSSEVLANYCEALADMQNNAIQEAIKYFVDDISLGAGDKAVKLINFGKSVIEAVMDPEKGRELGQKIGEDFLKDFTGKAKVWFGENKFTRFLDKIGLGGKKIEGLVEKYNNVKDLANNLNDIYIAGKEGIKNGDLYSSIYALSEFGKFSQGKANTLISFLEAGEKTDKSAILDDFTYNERPTGDEIRANPDSDKVKNWIEKKDGKYRLKM